MPQAHSLLWHYLWVAPHLLQLTLAVLLWRRGLHRQFPLFFSYLLLEATEELLLYGLDLSPAVSAETWWHVFLAGSVVEGLLRFAVIVELLRHVLQPWPALALAGRHVISGVGATLILFAAVAAALKDLGRTHWLISAGHILQQSFFLVQAGVIVAIVVFAAYFRIAWGRMTFGIAFGFAIVWCEHLALWAVLTTRIVTNIRASLDMVNMATYHVAVIIWLYYLLVPESSTNRPLEAPSDSSLDVWNRELERLLQP